MRQESFQNAREGMKPAETQTESTEAVLTELTLARMVSLDGPAADIKAGPMDDVLLGEGNVLDVVYRFTAAHSMQVQGTHQIHPFLP